MLSYIDIAPTILDVLGIQVNQQFQGQSMLPLIKGTKNIAGKEYAFGEASNTGAKFVRTNKWKFITRLDDPEKMVRVHLKPSENVDVREHLIEGEQLYDLEKDPRELDNILVKNSEIATQLQMKLKNWISINQEFTKGLKTKTDKVELTEQELKKLRSLGYIK